LHGLAPTNQRPRVLIQHGSVPKTGNVLISEQSA